MTASRSDIDSLLNGLRYELTACQAKLSDLKRMLANLPIPDEGDLITCPVCEVRFPTDARRDYHLLLIHGDEDAGKRYDEWEEKIVAAAAHRAIREMQRRRQRSGGVGAFGSEAKEAQQ